MVLSDGRVVSFDKINNVGTKSARIRLDLPAEREHLVQLHRRAAALPHIRRRLPGLAAARLPRRPHDGQRAFPRRLRQARRGRRLRPPHRRPALRSR